MKRKADRLLCYPRLMPRFPIPARFWHSYPAAERLPLPDAAEALASPVMAFPSWFIEAECVCSRGRTNQIALLGLSDRIMTGTIAQVVARLKCRECGARPVRVELRTGVAWVGAVEPDRIRLVG